MINELNFSQRTFLAAPTKSAPFGFVFLTFATTSSANDIVKSFNEIAELTKIKIDLKDADNTNGKIVDVLLKNNIVTIGNVDNLVESKKISIDNYLELKDKYKEEYND